MQPATTTIETATTKKTDAVENGLAKGGGAVRLLTTNGNFSQSMTTATRRRRRRGKATCGMLWK